MGSNAVLPPRGATWDLQSHGAGDAESTATSCLMGISKSAYYIDSPAFIVYKTFILVQLHSSSVVTKKLDVEDHGGMMMCQNCQNNIIRKII